MPATPREVTLLEPQSCTGAGQRGGWGSTEHEGDTFGTCRQPHGSLNAGAREHQSGVGKACFAPLACCSAETPLSMSTHPTAMSSQKSHAQAADGALTAIPSVLGSSRRLNHLGSDSVRLRPLHAPLHRAAAAKVTSIVPQGLACRRLVSARRDRAQMASCTLFTDNCRSSTQESR